MGGMRIISKDGQTIKIDLRYKDVATALDRCFDEFSRASAWQPRDYAPFTVTATEIRHDKKGAIALAEIEKVTVNNNRIAIKKRDKRLAWAACAMRNT